MGNRFKGYSIKVIYGATGRKDRFEFYYGGVDNDGNEKPDGKGHGHVVCNDGENIIFWRLCSEEGGRVVIDDRWSAEKLSKYMF